MSMPFRDSKATEAIRISSSMCFRAVMSRGGNADQAPGIIEHLASGLDLDQVPILVQDSKLDDAFPPRKACSSTRSRSG